MKIKPTPTLINIKIKSSRSIRSIHNATTRSSYLSDISNEIKKKRRKKGQPIRKKKKKRESKFTRDTIIKNRDEKKFLQEENFATRSRTRARGHPDSPAHVSDPRGEVLKITS